VFAVFHAREDKIQILGDNYREHIEKSIQMLKELVKNAENSPAKS